MKAFQGNLRSFLSYGYKSFWVCSLLLGQLALFAAPQALADQDIPTPSAEDLQKLDETVESLLAKHTIPGALVAVASRGKMIDLRTYGMANVELNVPVSKDNVFEIGSVSKQFIVVAALMLMEEGKLGLHDPIQKYLPFVPSEWLGITPYQLMTHTSGIPDYEEIRSYDVYGFRLTPEEIIKIAHSRPMDFQPGEGWYYSNTGYFLISMIVERIEGKPLGQVLEDRIFKPLGMNQTRMADPEAIIPHRASGYWVNKVDQLINRRPTETSSTLAAGGLLSSAADLAKWDAALYGDEVLSEKSKELMWTVADVPTGTNSWTYAMGWSLEPYKGLKTQWHTGQVAGFITRFRRFPDEGLMTLVFVNRYRAQTQEIEDAVLQTYIPSLRTSTTPEQDSKQ
ncbi:serine hydrolase [Kordiimonas sediminis]|uniref:Beta-lactamase n=1 Tax=Kordiimonas sediminis TaxID=1735581 RepID=A0A919APG4_9PROT|nr:serine hydrolase domain-containing protein [Kordiimonas sediminis]GHF17820.1 serine hydrolase [Kordiimonas sediminis]